jgi:hypothetical protein
MPKRGKAWPLVAAIAWLIAITTGMFAVFAYAARPGDAALGSPREWPADVTLARASDRPTVVMLAHPKCPCTRASMSELLHVVTEAQGRATFHVLFIQPDGTDDAWARSDTYARAKSLPGVEVTIDRRGEIAKKLGATTSGHVVVYDAKGALRFSGGITSARGHEGDNTGRQAVVALARGEATGAHDAKTYGCDLREKEARRDP